MKTFVKAAALALLGSSACLSVSAVTITGSVSMSTTPGSSWTGDGGDVNSIASISNFGVSQVDAATLGFAGLIPLGSVVIWGQPLAFASPAINNPLWSAGAVTFNLNADPLSVNRQDNAFPIADTLTLTGLGTLTAPGFDSTIGGWSWTGNMQTGESKFTFASTTQAAPPQVPDSGATVALLGLALSGLGFLRRHLA